MKGGIIPVSEGWTSKGIRPQIYLTFYRNQKMDQLIVFDEKEKCRLKINLVENF